MVAYRQILQEKFGWVGGGLLIPGVDKTPIYNGVFNPSLTQFRGGGITKKPKQKYNEVQSAKRKGVSLFFWLMWCVSETPAQNETMRSLAVRYATQISTNTVVVVVWGGGVNVVHERTADSRSLSARIDMLARQPPCFSK